MVARSPRTALFAALLLCQACTVAHSPSDDAGGDAAEVVDFGGPDAGPMCAHTIPTDGFGIGIGTHVRDLVPPLEDCAGMPHPFYGPDYCTSELTVVSLAAGWCRPSNLEADLLEETLIRPYGPRGVRFIQVLAQDDEFHAPTAAFCDAWLSRTNPASLAYQSRADAAMHALSATDHVTLLDPTGEAAIYNPGNVFPTTFIVDGEGVIQFRFAYADTTPITDALATTTDCLDKLLATPRQLCH